MLTWCNYSPGSYHAVVLQHHTIQHCGPHANQALITNGTCVYGRTMADGASITNNGGSCFCVDRLACAVYDDIVLYVGLVANDDGIDITCVGG